MLHRAALEARTARPEGWSQIPNHASHNRVQDRDSRELESTRLQPTFTRIDATKISTNLVLDLHHTKGRDKFLLRLFVLSLTSIPGGP